METQTQTQTQLEEIINFWSEIHDNETLDNKDNWSEDAKAAIVLAKLFKENNNFFQFFILSESNYNIDKANKLLDKLDRSSKIAEYIQIKFYDDPEAYRDFKSFLINELSKYNVNNMLKDLLDDMPDDLKKSLEKLFSNK